MKKYKALLFTLPVLAALAAAPAYVAALAGQDPVHEHGAKKAPAHAATAAHTLDESVIKKMLDRGRPAESINVTVLARLLGDWYYTAAFWAVPGVEPQRTKGKIGNEMILDGRFLSSTVLGSWNIGGYDVPVKGQGFIGYDNGKKSFTSVWIDTMTTGVMIGAGTYDKKANAIKETGWFTNPLNGAEERFRSELQFTSADEYKRTIFAIDKSGKESKLMEFDYSKRN